MAVCSQLALCSLTCQIANIVLASESAILHPGRVLYGYLSLAIASSNSSIFPGSSPEAILPLPFSASPANLIPPHARSILIFIVTILLLIADFYYLKTLVAAS